MTYCAPINAISLRTGRSYQWRCAFTIGLMLICNAVSHTIPPSSPPLMDSWAFFWVFFFLFLNRELGTAALPIACEVNASDKLITARKMGSARCYKSRRGGRGVVVAVARPISPLPGTPPPVPSPSPRRNAFPPPDGFPLPVIGH